MTRSSLVRHSSLEKGSLRENASLLDLEDCRDSPFESVAWTDSGLASHIVGVDNSRRPLLVEANWMVR